MTPAAEVVAQRHAAAQRPRRIVFNNDGCDCAYYPKDKPVTPENLLALRTTPLAGSQVDSIFYCSISSGFGMFTHRTTVGQVLTVDLMQHRNATTAFHAQGTDPLQIMVEFCRQHRMEILWSMRMNDTHDAANKPDAPYPLFPKLKEQHPDWLVGAYNHRSPNGPWSSVDYTRPEVRDLAFRYIEEVCRNYDVDGVEMDFLRHCCYFKSVAWGGVASQAECEMMTDLLRRVRTMADAVAAKRGKPILLAARVPDSVEYARAVGLDLERWLADGLVDLLIGSCYFQLNDWDYLVALGRKHQTPVYAGLSESRVKDEAAPFRRQSIESYRGRALAAWQAGVNGIYLFNLFNPKAPQWRELGDPAGLAWLDKLYFVSPRDGSPRSYLATGETFRQTSWLTAGHPQALVTGKPVEFPLRIGDDIGAAARAGRTPTVLCYLRVKERAGADALDVQVNGTRLAPVKTSGVWQGFTVPPAAVLAGVNQLRLELPRRPPPPVTATTETWTVSYRGDKVMAYPAQLPWRRVHAACQSVEDVRDGALYLADEATGPNDFPSLVFPWLADPSEETVVEARAKVVASSDPLGVCLRVADGTAVDYVTLAPDRIGLTFAKIESPLDTTAGFHTYRVVLHGSDIRVFVDGELKLDGTGKYTTSAADKAHWLGFQHGLADWNRRSLLFGSGSGPGTGAALWEFVRFRTVLEQVSLQDLVVSIRYPAVKAEAGK